MDHKDIEQLRAQVDAAEQVLNNWQNLYENSRKDNLKLRGHLRMTKIVFFALGAINGAWLVGFLVLLLT